MVISLGMNSQGLDSGINNAQKSLLKFQNSADKLKGVDLNSLKVNFDKQVTSLSQLQKEAREYDKALRYATDEKEIKALNRQLEETYAEMNRIKSLGKTSLTGIASGSNSAAKGMGNLAGSAGQVNMEFARIIQDAPYGMMGIGNNIQQLTANFGQLRQQAGSTRAALGAALSSLITPASALTLGIAALTSAWTVYQMWSQRSAKATKDTAKALGDAEQSVDDYIDSLGSLAQARLKGEREAQKELTTLRLLYKQTQNTSLSINERKRAVDELQKQYPSYFSNLKDEDVLAGKAASAYDRLSKSILDTAKARAAQELIAEKARQQLVNEQKIADLRRKEQSMQAQAIKQQETLAKVQERLRAQGDNSQAGSGAALQIRQGKELNAIIGERQKLELENVQIMEQIRALEPTATLDLFSEDSAAKGKAATDFLAQLREEFNLATKQAILFGSSYDEMGTKAELFKTAMIGLMEQGLKPQDTLIQSLKASYDLFAGTTLPNVGSAIDKLTKANLPALREELSGMATAFEPVSVGLMEMSESARAFFQQQADAAAAAMGQIEISAEEMTSFMQASIGNAIAGFGEALGQMIATGDVAGFFDSIMMIVADFAGNFGKALIAAGVAALAFESLLANPIAAIAAGTALVAAAGVVKSVLSKGPSGGGAGGPSLGGSGGYRSPNPNGFSTSFEGEKEREFVIRGEDLVLLVERHNYKKMRIRG
ncbi:hypothetical protein CLV24_11410 [Pontibacter ummariensis]|uniref:Uncharacterized protein n=2 Tax=Pontibacter ummariensis TaxID=1610492 RepID=A0A239HJU7_9BACT|nr:hypothetical protein CLV24_11410 [Pontibacter ummariensis]SNS81338.1 hypothetical protein SAMN06296052_11410 [Pontibacter ummariensis]